MNFYRVGPIALPTSSQVLVAGAAVIRKLRLVNTSGADRTFTISIGADAAGTRIYSSVSLAAGSGTDIPGPFTIGSGESLCGFASGNGVTFIASIEGDNPLEFNYGTAPDPEFFYHHYAWGDGNAMSTDPAFLQGDSATDAAQRGGYTAAALSVTGGVARITGSQTPTQYGGVSFGYRTGVIRTKQSWLYGNFKIRANVAGAVGQGLWSAIWMMPDPWRAENEQEIDLLEAPGTTSLAYQNVHWGTSTEHMQGGPNATAVDLTSGYHLWEVDWTSARIVWYLDGAEIWRRTSEQVTIPDLPLQVLCNIEIGSANWTTGYPNGSTPMPAIMDIDYIRVGPSNGL